MSLHRGFTMPGFPPLSAQLSGAAADSVRAAESLQRGGEPEHAAVMLEEALAASLAITPVIPGWLCGRLAALYRALGRLDDEVLLLEQYRDSQPDDDARTRYDARLSKARSLAERRRRTESGAVISVRNSLQTPRSRPAIHAAHPPVEVPAASLAPLADLLHQRSDAEFTALVDAGITAFLHDLRARDVPLHQVVDSLRRAARGAAVGSPAEAQALQRYSIALVRLLALHFSEERR
jgi:hypothetical protein